MKYWKYRNKKTLLYSCGGIDAVFNNEGRAFKNKVGAKGSLFHYVYGFKIDDDGVRRFHPRETRSIDDYEAVFFNSENCELETIQGREMFTRNQLLNKEDRILEGLSPRELASELKKQF